MHPLNYLKLSVVCFGLWLPLGAISAWVPPELSHELTLENPPRKAPVFQLQDMDESLFSLEQYRGKVVMLNFWATWCPPCRREMPSMERLSKMFTNDQLVVLAVNQGEAPDHVFAFLGQLETDPTFPILFDQDSQVALSYKVKGLPTTYLVDKQGMIRYRAIGGREFDHPEVKAIIEELINE